ncbi:MAG: DUF308 domain-containing protein [Muribaculaceae bacterium]|nr:DUF308 domain-containing protein [Muribaculaceae bacterium]
MDRTKYIYNNTRFWWIPLLTGLIFIGFGTWCLSNPSASLAIMAYIFAGAVGCVGIFNMILGFSNISNTHGWGWSVACGIVEILCAIWLFFLPSPSLTEAFIFCMGLYIIFVAINGISESFVMYSYSSFWSVWMFLLLVVAIVCACIFLAGPVVGNIAEWLYIGISFITYGAYRIMYSFKMKRINNDLSE